MEEKKLSEFLKENGAYESFIENCLNERDTLLYVVDYSLSNTGIFSGFTWAETSEGVDYWSKLFDKSCNLALNYDMDEVLYKEYERRNGKESSEQNPTTKDIVENNDEDYCYRIAKKKFEPFTLNIEVKTLGEAKSLWNRFNLSYNKICRALCDSYNVEFENRISIHKYWNQIDEILKNLGEKPDVTS